jgi:hypothetical protein
MSANLRRYHALHHALGHASPAPPPGHLARHLSPLAALISGIVGSKSTPLPTSAAQVSNGTTPASRVKRLARWVDNAHSLEEVSFLPYADLWRRHFALQPLGLVMEGSVAGRGCMALLLHVVSKGRARPLAGRVRQGPQGHCPDDLPSALGELVSGLLPEGAPGVLRGDGACDGPRRPHTVQAAGGSSVCRTGGHRTAWWDGEPFRLDPVGACRPPGTLVALSAVWLTRAHYGPLRRIGGWAKGWKEPLDWLSNMAAAEEACRLYAKRCRREPFFSEQKRRGFHLHTAPLSDPQRLSGLLIAACLAYIWMVYLGSVCRKEGWGRIIHRRHRCDLSLFQLGMRLLEHFLNEDLPIPVAFHIAI